MIDDVCAPTEIEIDPNGTPTIIFPASLHLVDPTPGAFDGAPPRPLATTRTRLDRLRRNFPRIVRYGTTSAIVLGISEATLLIIYAAGIVDAVIASLIVSGTGTIPSYLLSRYWIWPDADRRRVGRQVVLYWLTSFVAMAITSVAMGLVAGNAPSGKRLHVIVVGLAFLALNALLWIGKFVVYQKVIFPRVRQRQFGGGVDLDVVEKSTAKPFAVS